MSGGKLLEQVSLQLVTKTPLRIGAGVEGNLAQVLRVLVVRKARIKLDPDNWAPIAQSTYIARLPLIPATSIKGALRAITEKIAASLYAAYSGKKPGLEEIPRTLAALHHQPPLAEQAMRRTIGLQVAAPLHAYPDNIAEKDQPIPTVLREYGELVEKCTPESPTAAPRDWRYEAFASRYCPICLLYGSTHQAGAVRPLDAIPDKEAIETRTHVSINRRTRTRAEGKLYSEELVTAGTKYTLRINILWPIPTPQELEHPQCRELLTSTLAEARKLWSLTLRYIKETGLRLGSGKSRGNGSLLLLI